MTKLISIQCRYHGKSVKECSRSISIQNYGSDVRIKIRQFFWWDRFVQRPLVTYVLIKHMQTGYVPAVPHNSHGQ